MTIRPPTSFNLGRAGLFAGAFFCAGVLLAVAVQADRHAAVHSQTSFAARAAVIDGDTIVIGGQSIRLEGIDAPEVAQFCHRADGRTWPCGRVAMKALKALIGNNDVVCDSNGTDKYGRVLAVCFADGRDLNATMVTAGLAWAFVRYSQTYTGEEIEARRARVGIWQGVAQAPWDFRRNGWKTAEVSAPNGCAIKGNVSSKGHIYHMPWSPWYDRVTVEARRGEQWFCSENDAKAAGWRPALAF